MHVFCSQEKLVRAMFSHSFLYPPRAMPSLLDPRLVGFPPGTQPATAVPLFASPLSADRDPPNQLVHHSRMVQDQRCPFTEPTSVGQ